MKKITLFITALMAVLTTSAQDQKSGSSKSRQQRIAVNSQMQKNTELMRNGLVNVTAIFSEDFSGGIPGTWTVVDNVGAGLLWTGGFGPSGLGAADGDTLLSSTGSNGIAIADDDALGSTAPPRNTDMITPPINCAAFANVHIAFQDYFLQFNVAVGTLSISNDGGVTYTDIYAVSTTTSNPNINDIDVTAMAAGFADVRFKLNYQGDWDYWWQVDDINVFEPSAFDGAIVSVQTAETGCLLTSTEMVMISIRNAGVSPITNFPASFRVDGGNVVTENVSATINAGDTVDFMFAATADLSVVGIHVVEAWITVPSDGNTANDSTATATLNIAPTPINSGNSMFMGFEVTDDLTGWTINDANADGETWALAYNPAFTVPANTGDYCSRVAFANTDLDDWIISHCVNLQAGTNYVIDYWIHLFSNAAALETYVGTSNDISSMTQLITATPAFVGLWVNANSVFNVPNNGTYYIGFRAYEPTNAGVLRIDDINLSMVASIGESNGDTKWFDVYPNPASDHLTVRMNRPYHNATVEVINSLGAIVKSFTTEESAKTIDIANLESGIYTMTVKFDGTSVYKRFTISK